MCSHLLWWIIIEAIVSVFYKAKPPNMLIQEETGLSDKIAKLNCFKLECLLNITLLFILVKKVL